MFHKRKGESKDSRILKHFNYSTALLLRYCVWKVHFSFFVNTISKNKFAKKLRRYRLYYINKIRSPVISETKLRENVQFIQDHVIHIRVMSILFIRKRLYMYTWSYWRSFYICGLKNLTFHMQTRNILIHLKQEETQSEIALLIMFSLLKSQSWFRTALLRIMKSNV